MKYMLTLMMVLFALTFTACNDGADGPGSSASPTVSTASVPTSGSEPVVVTMVTSGHLEVAGVGVAPPPIGERIYRADVIVRANLMSTGDDQLNFRAIEYLKGTGDRTFSVQAPTTNRNTTWDNREAVLFLVESSGPVGSDGATGSAGTSSMFDFANTSPEWAQTTLPDGYTIDRRNPVWLPSTSSGVARSSGQGGSFITESVAPGGDLNPTITLAELKRQIAWQLADDSEGYQHCVISSWRHLKGLRDSQVFDGQPIDNPAISVAIESGSPAGTEIFRQGHDYQYWASYNPVYNKQWLGGDDADLFISSVDDEDEDATNEYDLLISTARPLPAGLYSILESFQYNFDLLCGYDRPAGIERPFNITVTAPEGTVHEAFFDPVSSGDAVGYFGTGDGLKPATFTTGDATRTVQSLKWQDSAVTLGLQPYDALTGQVLDFITGDGTTTLSLQGAGATGDSTAGTLTWAVGSQPWSSGDELMLRLRESQTTPSFGQDSYSFSVPESTSLRSVIGTVKAIDQDGDAVLHKITSGSDGGWFGIDGWEGLILLFRELDYETRTSYELTVTGTDPGGRSDSTTVTIEVTDVAE